MVLVCFLWSPYMDIESTWRTVSRSFLRSKSRRVTIYILRLAFQLAICPPVSLICLVTYAIRFARSIILWNYSVYSSVLRYLDSSRDEKRREPRYCA